MSLYINLDKTVLDLVRKYDGDICTICNVYGAYYIHKGLLNSTKVQYISTF